jgi:hypothetical protein
MKFRTILFDKINTEVVIAEFLKTEKGDGVKHAYYVSDMQHNAPVVFDTSEQYHQNIANYKKSNVHYNRTIDVDTEVKKNMNVAKAVIHVFRDKDPKIKLTNSFNIFGEFVVDQFGIAFGYLPADCEFTIVEITF